MSITAIRPERFPWFDYRRYTFSLGLDLGDWVVLSGHSASQYDPDEKRIVVNGGMRAQAQTCYDKIMALLETAGYGAEDIVRVTEYVTVAGVAAYPEAEQVRRDRLGESRPSVGTVVVNRLLRPDALVEIEVVAARGLVAPPDQNAARAGYAAARAAGSTIYLSSILPRDENGIIVNGDISAQAGQIYENASKLLAELGIGWDRIVKTADHITPGGMQQYKSTAAIRREFLGPVYPAATGVIVQRLIDEEAMMQTDFIASMNPLEAVNPGWDRYAKLTYNPAVRAGDVLYLSGQAALDPATERAVHAGDLVAQAEYIYSNIAEVLSAAGLGPQNLVKTIEYVTPEGLDRYRETAEVRSRWFHQPFPAATGLVCDRLLRPEFLIEVDPIAAYTA